MPPPARCTTCPPAISPPLTAPARMAKRERCWPSMELHADAPAALVVRYRRSTGVGLRYADDGPLFRLELTRARLLGVTIASEG